MINEIFDQYVNDILTNINFEKLQNRNILLTGASGLLGVHLVKCLKELNKKYNVKVYLWTKSNIPEYFVDFFDFDNIIINEDIVEGTNFDMLPAFDYILHCAGYGQPSKFLDEKIKTIQINTTATIRLFSKLKKGGTFLFLSSSEIYNGLDKYLINETEIGTSNTNDARSCYIESKRCGESICYAYSEKGYNVKIVRLSLAYGPGAKLNDKRVLNSLIEKGLYEDEICLLDSGDAIRTYCYVSDVVEMIWNILLHSKDIVYNVGGVSKLSILELANLIGLETDKHVKTPEHINSLKGSPKVVNIDINKYITEFNKTSFIPFDEGLKNTVYWQKHICNIK